MKNLNPLLKKSLRFAGIGGLVIIALWATYVAGVAQRDGTSYQVDFGSMPSSPSSYSYGSFSFPDMISQAWAAISGTISMNNNRVTNVATPIDNKDAANREWVNAQVGAAGGTAIIKPYIAPRLISPGVFNGSFTLVGTMNPVTSGWLMTVRKMTVSGSGDADSQATCFARVNYVTPPYLDTPPAAGDSSGSRSRTFDISAIDSSVLRDAIVSIQIYGMGNGSCGFSIDSGYEYQP